MFLFLLYHWSCWSIEWAVPEEMSIFMTLSASKWYVFIIYGLDTVFILIFYGN